MAYAFFIDTTVCTGCRGCQVACKQWHDLPAEQTRNSGSYQNPADLSFATYKLVRMQEKVIDGRLRWLFFPDQCRHCVEAPCEETAGDPQAVYRDGQTGAVLYSAVTSELAADDIVDSCPYNIPRKSDDGTLAKCDMCNDRVHNGLQPACVKTCPTGAMNFGTRDRMLSLADARLATVRKRHPQATLIDPEQVNVVYLVAYAPGEYHENAMAAADAHGYSRTMALRRMVRPLGRVAAGLTTG